MGAAFYDKQAAQNRATTAPLQRKKKGKYTAKSAGSAYTPASVIPGVKHQIEGRTDLNYQAVEKARVSILGESRKNAMDSGRLIDITTKKGRKATKANQAIDNQVTGFGLQDAARAKIRTVADPDALKAQERKKAARRRMKGRFGTLLSDRETLG